MFSESEILIYAIPEKDSDALYYSKFWAMDAVLMFSKNKKKIAVLHPLEFGRAKEEGDFDEVLNLSILREKAKTKFGSGSNAEVIALLAEKYKISSFSVPSSFPSHLFKELEKYKISLKIKKAPFFSERKIKEKKEIELIRSGNQASEKGLQKVKEILQATKVNKQGFLLFEDEVLNSEYLHREIRKTTAHYGASLCDPIVAGGKQGANPHCIGSGALRANELIIVDIFPRMANSGYHGDLTRTFLRGTASKNQIKLMKTLKKAHGRALDNLCCGVSGKKIDKIIRDSFEEDGFLTGEKEGKHFGCFCGIGHGLGLDVHEQPFLGKDSENLKAGMVITIEPGLYYPEADSARIEDVVLITETGWQALNNFSYEWQIPF